MISPIASYRIDDIIYPISRREMNMTAKTFKNQAEAITLVSPLALSKKIKCFTPVTTFGRTTVKVFVWGSWKPLTESLFNALVAA